MPATRLQESGERLCRIERAQARVLVVDLAAAIQLVRPAAGN
jgi:hypothetical protein